MSFSVAWRAAAVQAGAVFVVSTVLGYLFDRDFFVSYGWLAGPGAWAACALLTGAVLRLPLGLVFAGAALSGLPSLAAVLAGVHWAGIPLAVVAFGAWCGWLGARREASRSERSRSAERPVTARSAG